MVFVLRQAEIINSTSADESSSRKIRPGLMIIRCLFIFGYWDAVFGNGGGVGRYNDAVFGYRLVIIIGRNRTVFGGLLLALTR